MTVHTPNGNDDPIVRSRRMDGIPVWVLRWGIPTLVGVVIGIIGTTVATLEWGDRRYVRRDEYTALMRHADEDKATYAPRSEVVALTAAIRAELAWHASQPGHAGVKEELSIIRENIAGLRSDVAWLKERERRKGGGP